MNLHLLKTRFCCAEQVSSLWKRVCTFRCAQVSLLAASEMEEQLKLAVEELMRTPAALMQALLDHSHGSYSQELYAAARQLEQRQKALLA